MSKYLYIICLFIFLATTSVTQGQPGKAFRFVSATNLENVDYPFTVRYISLTLQGEQVKMAYMDVLPANPNGRTVMLLHGKNFCGAYWEQTATDLAAAGFRVIIPDQIGFGKSSKPNHIQYTFQLLAANTRALLDTLQVEKTAVVGHSMGGMVATRFTLMYPDRVTGLVLSNPIGLEDWKLSIPYPTVDEWYAGELKQTYQSMKQYQLTSYYGGAWRPEYNRWLEMIAGWTNNIDYPRIAWNSALTYDMIFTQPVCYEFDKIQRPTLLIIGQRDRTAIGKDKAPAAIRDSLGNYPQLGKRTAATIPNARLVELNNVGHLPHIEAYERFITPLLEFLNQ